MAANTRLRAGGLKRGPDAGRRAVVSAGLALVCSARLGRGLERKARRNHGAWVVLLAGPATPAGKLLQRRVNDLCVRAEPYHSLGVGCGVIDVGSVGNEIAAVWWTTSTGPACLPACAPARIVHAPRTLPDCSPSRIPASLQFHMRPSSHVPDLPCVRDMKRRAQA